MEECSEIIKTGAKILLHGYECCDPTGDVKGTNREQLEREVGDVLAFRALMVESGDLDRNSIAFHQFSKEQKISAGAAYLHHQN